MQAWIPVVSSSLFFWKRWGFYIKLKVSWLRACLWCMSQTIRDWNNGRRVQTHEKNSGETPIGHNNTKHFLCPIRSRHALEFLETVLWELEPRGSFTLLENFRRALSPDLTDCPWVSEDDQCCAIMYMYICTGGVFSPGIWYNNSNLFFVEYSEFSACIINVIHVVPWENLLSNLVAEFSLFKAEGDMLIIICGTLGNSTKSTSHPYYWSSSLPNIDF